MIRREIQALLADPLYKENINPPENPIEEKLAAIWSVTLDVPKVGTTENFFELGGNSLKAALLVSKILQEFQVELPLSEVFQNPTIKALVERIKAAETDIFSSIQQVAEKEYYAVSSAQKRMYSSTCLRFPTQLTTCRLPYG